MPSFEYTAIDRQGNSVQGQIQAGSRDEAALNLTRTGLLVSRLAQATATPSATVRPVSPQSGPVKTGAPPQIATQQRRTEPSRSVKLNPAAGAIAKDPIRTKAGTDKDLYFVFSQLQSYAKSGANPVQALTNVGNNARRPDYGEALLAAADAAKEGKPISEVFARYVDLFPPHVVGMIRAAEQGGFFPEAYDLITDQAHASHRFRIWFRWLLAVTIMVAGCLPLTELMLRAALESWDVQDKAGGAASGWGTLFSSIGHQFLWPIGPLIIVLILGTWLFARVWQSLPKRELRHRLVLWVPSVKKRARAESLSVFAWTMGMLSKVGLPPKTVWELSAAAIPNLEIRRQLEDTGHRMTEQTKLSEAMSMSRQVPEEYAPIVQTGEVTGDIPTALNRASQAQLDEFKAGDQGTKMRVGCWMLLIMFLGSAIMFGMYYGGFMKTLMDKISGE